MSKQSNQSNPTPVDLHELAQKVSELYSDYEWRQTFDKAKADIGERKLAKTLASMDEKGSYENVRGEVIEHLSILEAIAEGIMAAKENEQTINEATARGLLYEFERFSAAVIKLIETADDVFDL